MRVHREIAERESKLDMTPMIDVTFLLLIFFMCTLKFKTLEGKLAAYLPDDAGRNPSPAEQALDVEVSVRVVAVGTRLGVGLHAGTPWSGVPGTRYTFGADREIEYGVGPRTFAGLDELRSRLRELHASDPTRKAKIRPGAGVLYGEAVDALDALLSAGFEEVRIVGADAPR